MTRTAIVTGHTGLVGRHLLDGLLGDSRYSRVIALGRRAPAATHAKLENVQTDFSDLKKLRAQLTADDAYCCLGTTLRAAGSKAAFERVDYHMVVDFARAAHAAGAKRFFLVSSLSANPRSPIFYSRVKGRTEQSLGEVGFETVHILRPSLLLGERGQEQRTGEEIAQKLSPVFNALLLGPLSKYRAVRGEEVAAALITLSHRADRGSFVHTLPLDR